MSLPVFLLYMSFRLVTLCFISIPDSSTILRFSGSQHLGTVPELIDCSMLDFIKGDDEFLPLIFRLRTIDAVIITHSHADAIGGL